MKHQQARWNIGVTALALSGLVIAISTALAEPATVPTPIVDSPTTSATAPTSAGSESSAAIRAMVEKRLAPQVGELEQRLDELRKQAPADTPSGSVKKRIAELQHEVGAIQAEVDRASARLLELRANRQERRAKSLGTLERQWGAANLQRPEVTAELATHARRVARLNRAKEVARDTDNDSAKKRAAKLLAKENRRHEAAMKELVPARPDPPASTTSHP